MVRMKRTQFLLAFKEAARLYTHSWRKLLFPGCCISGLAFLASWALMRISDRLIFGVEIQAILLISLLAFIFLLGAGALNLLLDVFQTKEVKGENAVSVFTGSRLVRLMIAFIALGALGVGLGLVSLTVGGWPLLFLIPPYFWVVLAILEKSDGGVFHALCVGLVNAVTQRWEIWSVWLVAWLAYRIIARGSWLLAWWLPNRLLGVEPHGHWIWAAFILLISCVIPYLVFLILFLRSIRLEGRGRP